jgi:cytochrome bd-type quinol oxidase subunit 1
MTFLILSFASLVVTGWFYFVGATLLEGSGFLVAYTFVSRPRAPLYVEVGYAVRLVSRNPAIILSLVCEPSALAQNSGCSLSVCCGRFIVH